MSCQQENGCSVKVETPGSVGITKTAAIFGKKKHDFPIDTVLGWQKVTIGTQKPSKAH